MARLALQLIEEMRQLQAALQAERPAREAGALRQPLSDRTFLVTEEELPRYLPFTRAQIARMRTTGKLRFIPDPLGRKGKYLYNLRDVEATLLAGAPRAGPLVREVDWEKVRIAV